MARRVTPFYSSNRGPLANTVARELKIEVDGLPTLWATVRLTGGTGGFCPVLTGGHMTEWASSSWGGLKLMNAMKEANLAVADVIFERNRPDGWWKGGVSIKAQAEYMAAILDYLAAKGPMKPVGNSGGAGALGYYLTTYGGDANCTLAVLASPAMTRLDLAISPADPAWETEAGTLLAGVSLTSPPVEIVAAAGSLTEAAQAGRNATDCRADSVCWDGADMDVSTNVKILWGTQDTSCCTPLALKLNAEWVSTHSIASAVAPHRLWDTDAGIDAIKTALGI